MDQQAPEPLMKRKREIDQLSAQKYGLLAYYTLIIQHYIL